MRFFFPSLALRAISANFFHGPGSEAPAVSVVVLELSPPVSGSCFSASLTRRKFACVSLNSSDSPGRAALGWEISRGKRSRTLLSSCGSDDATVSVSVSVSTATARRDAVPRACAFTTVAAVTSCTTLPALVVLLVVPLRSGDLGDADSEAGTEGGSLGTGTEGEEN